MDKVKLELTLEQARAISAAADLYARIGIGQLEEIKNLVSMGIVPARAEHGEPVHQASMEVVDLIGEKLSSAKGDLGFHPNGSRGIGHQHNHMSVLRSWEVKKVLDKALALHRDPNPSFPNVDYDGLILRLTDDPEPIASVVTGAESNA